MAVIRYDPPGTCRDLTAGTLRSASPIRVKAKSRPRTTSMLAAKAEVVRKSLDASHTGSIPVGRTTPTHPLPTKLSRPRRGNCSPCRRIATTEPAGSRQAVRYSRGIAHTPLTPHSPPPIYGGHPCAIHRDLQGNWGPTPLPNGATVAGRRCRQHPVPIRLTACLQAGPGCSLNSPISFARHERY